MFQYLAVAVEDLALGDKTNIFAFLINDGQVPRPRVVKYLHHLLHDSLSNLNGIFYMFHLNNNHLNKKSIFFH